MSKEQREEQIAQLRLTLQRKDTEELLEIWKKNDTAQWTPEAFETIREILLERTGSLPGQDEKAANDTQLITGAGENMDVPNKPHLSMTKRSFVSLFLKLVAIYFLVRSIPSLLSVGDSLYRLGNFGYPESLWMVLSSIFLLLVFAAFMFIVIWKSDRLSIRFISGDEPLFPIGKLSSEEIQRLGFSWIGILTLISGVSGVVYNLAYFVRIKFMVGAEQVRIPYIQNSSQFISSLSEMIIGIFLFLYPSGLIRLWHSIQRQRFEGQEENEEKP